MVIVASVLSGLLVMLTLAVALVMLWQIIIGLRGIKKYQPRPMVEQKQYTFAVLTCARNEQAVIGRLIDSLNAQDYPKTHFQVFVIADNCTDDTAGEARRHGARVYERFNQQQVGKGYALNWALERLFADYPDTYDAIAVFDADNLADKGFLTAVNAAMCTGTDIVQGYRETKNPFETWISGSYAVNWYVMTRFYHQARYNAGMSCLVGGTGFAFKRTAVPDGWHTCTITEDSEFAVRKVLEGHTIMLARDALFYDEQPTTWRMSIRQRRRWMAGYTQEFRVLLGPVWRAARRGVKDAFDMWVFLLSLQMTGVLAVMLALGVLQGVAWTLVSPTIGVPLLVGFLLSLPFGCWLFPMLLGLLTVKLEKGQIGRYRKAVLSYPMFLLPLPFLVVAAWFKKQVEWKPIEHNSREEHLLE